MIGTIVGTTIVCEFLNYSQKSGVSRSVHFMFSRAYRKFVVSMAKHRSAVAIIVRGETFDAS